MITFIKSTLEQAREAALGRDRAVSFLAEQAGVSDFMREMMERRAKANAEALKKVQALIEDATPDIITDAQASVLLLRYCEGKQWKQVAHALGASVTWCRMQANGGITALEMHRVGVRRGTAGSL